MPFRPFVTSPNAKAAYLRKESMWILEENSHRLTALLWNRGGKKQALEPALIQRSGLPTLWRKSRHCFVVLVTAPKRQPDDRQMHALSVGALTFPLCRPRQINITPASTMGGRPPLGLSSAMPVARHRRLPLTPSCFCVQHSSAGPPPVKQMAGNNTVTHTDR